MTILLPTQTRQLLGALVIGVVAAAPFFVSLTASASEPAQATHDVGAHHDGVAHDGAADDGATHDGAAHQDGADGDSHGEDAHGGHHVPTVHDINWFYGLIGEKEGAEPSLLWRPVGMPVPFGALLINTAILFFVLGRFGGPAIRSGLTSRRQRIAGDIDRAARMKEEAAEQLAHYENKLEEMASEMERIKKEMREQAEAERARILAGAKARRVELEAEARRLIEQELADAREHAVRIAVSRAMKTASTRIEQSLTEADHERLATGIVGNLEEHLKNSEAHS